MTNEIFNKYAIRKSKRQKTKFIEYVKEKAKENNLSVSVMKTGLFKSRNIVVGDVEKAKYVLTAHYDTCAICPLPNMMCPITPIMYWFFQILIFVLMLAIGILAMILTQILTDNYDTSFYAFETVIFLLCIQTMFGLRNPHTANDNSSGVAVLLGVMEKCKMDNACIVFFDNEEKGMFGSKGFKRKYKGEMKEKFLINFDCVGDGDHMLFAYGRKNKKPEEIDNVREITEKIKDKYNFTPIFKKILPIHFPSDHINFQNYIGVGALHKTKYFGYYAGRIHTPFDTVCKTDNIDYLVNIIKELII